MEALTSASQGGSSAGGEKPSHLVWMNFLACFMIFSEGLRLGNTPVGEIRLQYVVLIPLLALLVYFLKGVYMNLSFTLVLIALGADSFWNILEGKDTYLLLFKQLLAIYLNAALCYMVLKLNGWEVRPLFQMYLRFCVAVAAFGILQEAGYVLGIRGIYDLSWLIPGYGVAVGEGSLLRIHSVMSEPSSFALVLTPAFFAAIISLSRPALALLSPRDSIIIMGAMALSFSSVGYIGVFIAGILLMINYGKIRWILIMLAIIPALGWLTYATSIEIRKRVDDSLNYLNGTGDLEKINLSSFAIFSNMHVAYRSFVENPLLGSGLGSHPISYGKHIGNIVDLEKTKLLLNKEDANSLFLRLMSETGLLGLAMVFWFLFRFRLPMARDGTGGLWIMNNGIFVYIALRLIRFGHYFDIGFFIFFWIYYYTYKIGMGGWPAKTVLPQVLQPLPAAGLRHGGSFP
jgi:hypothetical protein